MSRHLYTRCFALVVLSIILISAAQSQWVPTAGPEGGIITSLDAQGASVLSTTTSGIFLSSDQGASWSSYNEGITDFSNNFNDGIIFNGTEMLVATTRSGVLVRQIGGPSWQAQNTGLPNTFILKVGNHGGTLFAAPISAGVYRSSDNGSSWEKSDSGLQAGSTVNQFFTDGPRAWAATSTGLYRSTDDGISWTARDSGFVCTYAWSITRVGSTLMCGTCDGLYISSDEGVSWTLKSSGFGIPTYYGFASTTAGVYASTFGGVSWSTDTGESWSQLSNGLPGDYYISIRSIGNKLIIGGSYSGIFASTDDGQSWTPSSAGLRAAVSLHLLADGTGIVAGTGSGLFRSTNEGGSWSAIFPGGVQRLVRGLTSDDQYLYAAVSTSYSAFATYRSSNEGVSWDSVQTGLPNYAGLFGLHSIGSMVFAATPAGLFGSSDHGSSWAGMGFPVGITTTRSITGTPDMIFAATSRGVFASGDSGRSWVQKNNGLTDTNLACIDYSAGYLLTGTYSGGIYRSTDSGATWGSSGPIGGPTSFASIGQTTFLTTSYGLRRSTDHGVTWSQSGTGLVDSSTYGIAEQNGYLFVATGNAGVWKRPKDELVTGLKSAPVVNLPAKFDLKQNYPNPFNPTTEIGYSLRDAGFVTLKIFDVLGKEVATLVNEVQQPGTHFTTWDAASGGNGMPSGVYFYQLQTRPVGDAHGTGMIETKKLILMK